MHNILIITDSAVVLMFGMVAKGFSKVSSELKPES